MIKSFLHSSQAAMSRQDWKSHLVFVVGGILVGLVATFMAYSSEWANHVFHSVIRHSIWLPFVISPLGLMLVVWLTRKIFPGSEGSGIPQVMATLDMENEKERNALLSLRVAAGKVFLCILGLLSGASIGREGPSVHVGAAIMYSMRHWINYHVYDINRVLIIAGGAAGVAAAFNTPLAGLVFAIEELSRSFEVRTRGLLLAAVMAAAITAIAIAGNYTYFGSISSVIDTQSVILPGLICGLAGGILGGVFSMALIHGSRRLVPYRNNNPYMVALLCGLAIAVIGLLSGSMTYGSGYEEAKRIVTGEAIWSNDYAYFKLLATVVSYLSGIPGGIFAPSLATGAGLGEHIASLLAMYPHGAIVLLGMVGYFSGVVQAPITAFVIVMEMTDRHELILPMMVTAFIAASVSKLICVTPIYCTLADQFRPDDKKLHN